MERMAFPRGVFRAEPGEIEALIGRDPGRYNCLRPAAYVLPECEIGDCWIVDQYGKSHPGYSLYPVPIHRDALGERV